MPLSQRALEKFSPLRVFLGHIHLVDQGVDRAVVYPGSPCVLEINCSHVGQEGFVYGAMPRGLGSGASG